MTTRLLAAAIAAQLPGKWHLLPGEDSWHGTLKRDDGVQFWIRDERGGRISAHKDAPAKCDPQWYRGKMSTWGLPDCDMVTMSADRAPEALALTDEIGSYRACAHQNGASSAARALLAKLDGVE